MALESAETFYTVVYTLTASRRSFRFQKPRELWCLLVVNDDSNKQTGSNDALFDAIHASRVSITQYPTYSAASRPNCKRRLRRLNEHCAYVANDSGIWAVIFFALKCFNFHSVRLMFLFSNSPSVNNFKFLIPYNVADHERIATATLKLQNYSTIHDTNRW